MMWLMVAAVIASAAGHGRVLQPASRATAWRRGFPTQPDYDDDGVNCGGFNTQWAGNKGKCGICGDAYNIPPPRPHELGGRYGQGVITASYQPGSLITTTVQLTASHLGFWEFKLCPDPEDIDQGCFDSYPLELQDGGTRYYPIRGSTTYEVTYRLPVDLSCEHCVLQWRYTAGNNWGVCKNGTQGLGCGNQETFGACSDIAILPTSAHEIPYWLLYQMKTGVLDAEGLLLMRHADLRPRPRKRTPRKQTQQKTHKHKRNKKKKRKKKKKQKQYWKKHKKILNRL